MGTNIPRHLLLFLLQNNPLPYFVETGTAAGITAALMSRRFEKVWTVELVGDRQKAAAKYLRVFSNVICTVGNSPDFLRGLMPQLDKPAMFWLDGHWCGGPKLGPECPLLAELASIGSLNVPGGGHHVILIDDARYFVKPPPLPHDPAEWPTYQQIQDAVAGWGVKVSHVDDVILIEAAK